MKEKYLVVNAGSSSLKFTLYEMPNEIEIVNGLFEKIGNEDSSYTLKYDNKKEEKIKKINNHTDAVRTMLEELIKNEFINSPDEIKGIGLRTVHGASKYSSSILIDDNVINSLKECTKLAPSHHPGEISSINALKEVMPNVPEVAVYDTAFHQTMPKENYMYALPYSWYEKHGVRKYGFHGTSHKYITNCLKKSLNKESVNLIICHIGSGASISCIKDGICVDTSMGMTPLDGLIMGTRSGSIDPSIIKYIMTEENLTIDEIMEKLNKESGLKGICGKNDFRDVQSLMKLNDKRATLAYIMFKKSIIKYIAQYYFELKGKIDAIVFTAGIGENVFELRKDVINDISDVLGITLNDEVNNNISRKSRFQEGIITTIDSKFPVYVIPTDEEKMILEDTYDIVKQKRK